jgi:nucleoside-diphosphate-sugar epimerase
MTDLVTGATGFIGRRLVELLVAAGRPVRALARATSNTAGITGAEIVQGDLLDPASLEPALRGVRCVHHLAAAIGDWGPAALFRETNTTGTRNLLEAAARASCARFVFVSSFAVYGSALLQDEPCDEERALSGTTASPYASSKRAAEALVREHQAASRMATTVIRPGNVYGSRSRLWVDEVVKVLRRGAAPLVGGGHRNATLAHVDNVADLIIRAGDDPAAAGKIYNVTDGSDVTWRRYFTDLARAAGAEEPTRVIPESIAVAAACLLEAGARLIRKKDRPLLTREAVRVLRCRAPIPIARAQRDLGWSPPVSYERAMTSVAAYLRRGAGS